MKKLYKSRIDRKICGVCGGIAEYLDIDSSIVRVALVISFFCFGVGLIPYIIAAIIIPENPNDIIY